MRCPKCGFNSFDHNPACPKCRRDLTAARRLLNLSVPAPGTVDFFKTAAHTAVFSEPFVPESLLEELEIVPEAVDTVETIEAMEPAALSPAVPAPIQAETEDIEPIGEIEEIEPDTEEAGLEDEELEDEEIEPADEEEDIVPLGTAEEEPIEDIYPDAAAETPDEDEDISPLDHGGGNFAQRLAEAQAAVSPADDEAIEIEPDEIEVLEAEPVDDDFDADPGIPPFVESALTQVKSALIATGDLAADDDAEQEPELWLEPEIPAEAEPEVEAAAVPEEIDIIDVAAIPEPSPDETRLASDDGFLDDDFNALSSLMDNLNIEDIDKKSKE